MLSPDDQEKTLIARRTAAQNYLENLPTLSAARDYRVEVDRLTGGIFVWAIGPPLRILGAVFRHGGTELDPGPVWSATACEILVARGVSREMAVGCLVLALWEGGL